MGGSEGERRVLEPGMGHVVNYLPVTINEHTCERGIVTPDSLEKSYKNMLFFN